MKYWTMQNGQKIKLTDMTDSHLDSTIKMIGRQIDSYPGDQVYMGDSEYADDAVESENRINRDRLDDLMTAYKALKHEQTRRKPKLSPVIGRDEVAKFRDFEEGVL